ncbi:M23 family metallopeptidase [Roseomonas sp. OT10]|uniref:M23 family metallopeptidase n=1 Tax=Roseomonas cutis TaxID=2897332 RepID=UPI001E562FB7|nr:M23 family metallopeptidase [Roseomonas sp. OT10]UFN47560.1 M23 family metallopeptidase [Roseomonas sp. OT10]
MIARRSLLALPALALPACATAPAPQAVAAGTAPVQPLALSGPVSQGGLVTGRAAPGSRVTLDGRTVPVAADGTFALGFGRDATGEAVLAVTAPGGRTETRRLAIAPREWDVQRISGLPPAQVTPDPRALARIRAEQKRLNAARRTITPVPRFAEGFVWPVRGRISGHWGNQRILNGQPRAPHLGLDIAAPQGTPIGAMAAGRVTLAGDLYFTGNTLLVEHGLGITSLYAHLSRVDVAEGQEVGRGQTIGLVGATGRATGPHLHLGLFWLSTPVDPEPLLPA